jgi:site-specific DNA recombinase
MRLGGYVRNSVYDTTKERSQEEPADSPARQERDLRRLADARGDEVGEVYRDLDISGWSGRERPGFEQLLEDADAGLIDGVIVWKLDRLTRNFDDLQRIWKLVQARGFRLVSVHDSIDTSTLSGVLGLRMGIAIAEMESNNTSLRVRDAMEEAAKNGQPHRGGTSRPFGYTDHSRQEPHPVEHLVIREAVERLLAGATLASVVKAVNDARVRTPGSRRAPEGKTWRTGTFAEMLISPGLAGLRAHKGELYPGAWEPIVSRDEHERLTAMRKDPGRVWLHAGQPRKHLLAGLLYCGREGCGEKLHSKPVRGVPRYKCPPAPYGRGCGRVSISAPHIERVILERLWVALDTPELAEAIRAPADPDPDLARQLDEDDQALKQAAQDHYVTKILPRPAFLEVQQNLDARMRQTRARQARKAKAAVFAVLPSGIAAVQEAWEGWDLERRRALVDACIAKIEVDPAPLGSRQGRAFDRSRVRITWRV